MFQSLSFLPILISKRALRDLVALRGQKSMKKRNLRIQGRMQIFEKISQKALNRVLTLPDYSIWPELLISSGIIDLQNNRVCKQFKHWKYRISVPMLSIAFIHGQQMSRIQTIYCHSHKIIITITVAKIIIIISAPFTTTTIIIPGGGEKDELWAYIGRGPNSMNSSFWRILASVFLGHSVQGTFLFWGMQSLSSQTFLFWSM